MKKQRAPAAEAAGHAAITAVAYRWNPAFQAWLGRLKSIGAGASAIRLITESDSRAIRFWLVERPLMNSYDMRMVVAYTTTISQSVSRLIRVFVNQLCTHKNTSP